MSHPVSDAVQQARGILRGKGIDPQAALPLVQQLQRERAFGYARKVLIRVRRDPQADLDAVLRLRLAQAHSLCTYKDPDLPPSQRLDRALEILRGAEDLERTRDPETLGQAGAIYKRRWELDNQRANLERAVSYYRRGYEAAAPGDPGYDYGYNGINAAFVLDLLAHQEEQEARAAGSVSASAAERRQQAREIRRDLTGKLPPLAAEVGHRWWFLATVGEAYFGLPDYERAEEWFRRAAALPDVPDWERESTARQLAWLARLQDRDDRSGPAWKALGVLLGGNAYAVQSMFRGKVGLALSGGGFRASLFHVGVLARLAEHDALRSVEVLSCVSGGSIVGAHYYLKVRQLLEQKPDAEITRDDYIRIVAELKDELLAGVQRNIRTRVAAEWTTNLKMLFLPHYSRSMRAGELYEREIYSRVIGDQDEIWLNDLQVRPKGEPAGFSPKDHNWRRANKVPILVLNATSLNTGHNWQFTTTWMGEPPSAVGSEVDGNYRLRRLYYASDDTPERHRKVRLGHAVAASAGVPGLFEPIALPDLYPDRTVRLVDGGVHDNQGTGSLLEQACTVLLVSDASGQMDSLDHPATGPLGGVLRSNSILQARVREAQYHELDARRRSSLIQGLMFLHLKKDLNADPVDWLGCQEPFDPADGGLPETRRGPLTRYGIQKGVQRRLAAIRTDLDSFTDVEAHALMTSAYCMTEHELPACVEGFPHPTGQRSDWDFLELEPALAQPATPPKLMRQLDAGSSLAFKVWALLWPLKAGAAVLGAAALVALFLTRDRWWSFPLAVTLGAIATALLFALAGKVFGPVVVKVVRYRKTISDVVLGVAMMTAGFLLARLHLHVFDRLFLWQGRIPKVLGLGQAKAGQPPAPAPNPGRP